ncbi:MAG TPA: hypothetical protein VFL07_09345 [Rudaea sp.]|nr:hypothetical protein [Rudaea sp.]
MKTFQICIGALAMLTGAISAQAHQHVPDAKITMLCQQGWTPHMTDVARAVERSHFSATPGARKEMLTLTREACASGSKGVAFVPPQDRR